MAFRGLLTILFKGTKNSPRAKVSIFFVFVCLVLFSSQCYFLSSKIIMMLISSDVRICSSIVPSKIFEQNSYYTSQVSEVRDQVSEVSKEIVRLRHSFERELSFIYESKSWKITAPLRSLANRLRTGKKIMSNMLVSLKNNSTRDFLAIYLEKCRRLFMGTLGDMEKKNWDRRSSTRGTFFQKYKRRLNKAIRKKK